MTYQPFYSCFWGVCDMCVICVGDDFIFDSFVSFLRFLLVFCLRDKEHEVGSIVK